MAEALLLFCQGLGLLASVARKFSRQGSLTASLDASHRVDDERLPLLQMWLLVHFIYRKKSISEDRKKMKFAVPQLDSDSIPEVSANFEQVVLG